MTKLKFIKKISAISFAVIAFSFVSVFLSSSEVSAWDGSCPGGGNPPHDWGVHTGSEVHGMAGLLVRARDSSGNNLNDITYRVRSDVPGKTGNITTENGEVVNVDDRIFKWPLGTGRTDSRDFTTGKSDIYLKSNNGTGGDISGSPKRCDGWSVLGPGGAGNATVGGGGGIGQEYIEQWGNHWVLDCAQPDENGDGQPEFTDFWIPYISTPTGPIGEWGGRWEIVTPKKSGGTDSKFLDTGFNKFQISNGESRQVTLIWHPNSREPLPPPPENDCTFSKITGSKFLRKKVEVSRISGGDKFYDGNPDGTHSGGIDAWVPSPPGESVDGEHTKRWNYKARDRTIHIKITESEWKDNTADGVANPHWVDSVARDDDVVCYDATCDLSMTGNVTNRPSGVEYGSGFTVNAHVHNRANPPNATPLWAQVDGRPLILAENDGSPVNFWYNPGAPDGLGRNQHSNQTWNVTEPGWSIGHYGIDAKLYYDFDPAPGIQGGDFVVADCTPTSYDVYKEFKLEPSASSMTPYYNAAVDYEDPNRVVMAGSINNDIEDYREAKMTANATGTFNKNGSDFFSQTKTYNNLGFSPIDFEASITNPRLGDRYCGRITVSPYLGWQGPSDRVDIIGSKTVGDPCTDIVNHPYTRIYGADVVAGSNFLADEVCNAGNSQIRAYTSSHADKSGSGAQLAAVAMNTIESFRTASLRTSVPTAPNGLSFGNDGGPTGQYNGEPLCSTDFYNETQSDNPDKKDTISNATINLSSPASYHFDHDQTLVSNPSHRLSLNGVNGFDDKKIIYVDGDVRINSNIAYSPFSEPTKAPAFMLVASGNIYVSRNVTRLDGIYVAQKRPDGSGGTIFTCAKPGLFAIYNSTEIFNNCGGPEGENANPADDRRLIVNGAFIANDVRLHRIHKSVRDSKSNTNETADYDPNAVPHNTEASEIFNFSPEIYLSQPPFATDSSATSRFQYYSMEAPFL